jgi:hypothetical protein
MWVNTVNPVVTHALIHISDVKVPVRVHNIFERFLREFEIESLTKLTPQEAEQQSKQLKNKTGDNARLEFKATDVLTTSLSVAGQVFGSLFLILLIIFCGSLAANQAIGRDPIYRVIYFIWGMVFFPFVAIQCLLQRLRVGPIPMYGILPVSTEPGTTRLGKLLWAPFYWIPDIKSDAMKEEYLKSLSKIY